jgi:hypothetical protein
MSGWINIVAWVQAVYFLITGVWPILHIRSFMAVTGPKTDLWLVKTVGVLVSVVGAVIAMAAARDAVSWEIVTLAIASAAALGAVDVIYVTKRVIDRIYLLDAVAEALLIVAWLVCLRIGH